MDTATSTSSARISTRHNFCKRNMKRKQMLEIMNEFKVLVGLGDFKVLLNGEFQDLKDNFAEVEPDIWEKTLSVKLAKKFKTAPFPQQRNILIHEMVHARFGIFSQKCAQLAETEEELFINDVVRGLEQLKIIDKEN
jgi:hypothetical protein